MLSKGEYSGAVERYAQAAIDNGKIRPDQRDGFMAHLATDVSEGGADIDSNAAVRGLLQNEDFSIVDDYVQGATFQAASEAAVIDTSAPAALDFNEIPGLGGEIPEPVYNT